MNAFARRWGLGSLVACGVATSVAACHDDVSLGAFPEPPSAAINSSGAGAGPSAGTGGATATLGSVATTSGTLATTGTASVGGTGMGGAAGDTSNPPPLPACLTPVTPGPANVAGQLVTPTELATDWTWPAPVTSMQWELMVENEIVRPEGAAPTIGYYYTHQFSFQEGISGFLGIQAEGGYSAPGYQEAAWRKIAVFWLAAEVAELGDDIPPPYSRVSTDTANGVEYRTIHAVFEWQACRVYRFRLALHSTESDGRTWYGAWIDDVEAGTVTFLGRMLLPAGAGLLTPFSTSRTQSIDFPGAVGCQYAKHASVLFGTPSSEDGLVRPTGANRFAALGCAGSRFSLLEGAIRHEIASP